MWPRATRPQKSSAAIEIAAGHHRGGVQFEKSPKDLSFRSAGLSREESAVSLPATTRFLADKTGFRMTRKYFCADCTTTRQHRNWRATHQIDTMTITNQENQIWRVPFFCRCRSWMVTGCILRACLWAAGGMGSALRRAMKAISHRTTTFVSSAIWGMPRNVHACRPSAISTPSGSRWLAITVHGCCFGLSARPDIARQSTAHWSTTSTEVSGCLRTQIRASRKCWSVTSKPIYSVESSPLQQPHW
jgi:hypothetical protein